MSTTEALPDSRTWVRPTSSTGPEAGIRSSQPAADIPTGAAAAAILAAGIGCFAVGLFALAGDAFPAAARFFTFYQPTGPLSGVTTSALIVWLVVWYALSKLWQGKSLAMGRINGAAFASLALGLLLTFPPFMDLLQGK